MGLRPVFLIGPRGCGKSSAGAEAAAMLGLPFCDCDALFEQKSGRSIAAWVESKGWADFRRLEAEILRDLPVGPGIVATGGGVVLLKASRALLRERGLVLYLSAGEEILRQRLKDKPDPERRPPFARPSSKAVPGADPGTDGGAGADQAKDLELPHEARLPLYQSTAHHSIDASRPLRDVAADIAALARNFNSACGQGAAPS